MSGLPLPAEPFPAGVPGPARAPVVHKFGGTSLEDAGRIRRVAELIRMSEGRPVVVVSAMAGVTELLTDLARGAVDEGDRSRTLEEIARRHMATAAELDGTPDGASIARRVDTILAGVHDALTREGFPGAMAREDAVVAAGEDLSQALVALALERAGVNVCTVDARSLIRTDSRFGGALPDLDAIDRRVREHVLPLLDAGRVPVIQGFLGSNREGRTTTLGRGGSDYTATLVGAPLGAREVVIWTDVSGIQTADPRAVEGARTIREMGFEEAVELAYFGAGVIHVSAAKHAVAARLPLRIRDSGASEDLGTRVDPERRGRAEFAAVAFKPAVVLVKVRAFPTAMAYGFLARVFEVLSRHEVPVDLVATSHSSTAFTIDREADLTEVHRELGDFAEVEVLSGLATVTVVGRGLMSEPGMEALAFWAVGRTPVHLISQASDVSLSFVVSEEDAPEAVRRLHFSLIELRGGG